jgi:hypothetical protein
MLTAIDPHDWANPFSHAKFATEFRELFGSRTCHAEVIADRLVRLTFEVHCGSSNVPFGVRAWTAARHEGDGISAVAYLRMLVTSVGGSERLKGSRPAVRR